jgi:hypothetical protein
MYIDIKCYLRAEFRVFCCGAWVMGLTAIVLGPRWPDPTVIAACAGSLGPR